MPKEPERTTFSRDVFGRFSCNTWDEATQDPDEIDVVVFGSGMYGGYCGSKIFEISRERFGRLKSDPKNAIFARFGYSC